GGYDPSDQAFFLVGGFALLAVMGAALGSAGPVRRLIGRMRPVADPATRRGGAAVLPVIAALVVSSVFAVAAGILMAAQSTAPIIPGTGLEWTGIAVGTALFAGTSAFGRRGGIFGTLLAVAGLTLVLDYSDRRDLDISLFAVAAALIGVGLVVTRLVETYGRPLPAGVSEDEWTGAASAGTAWSPDLPESWSPPVPEQNRPDRWDDGPWGTSR
ncbi:MAG TPA: ABC transporter permease, partial [Actinoplanes sp.]|nr:ABC transporter permease [Actinoplanes sp.]